MGEEGKALLKLPYITDEPISVAWINRLQDLVDELYDHQVRVFVNYPEMNSQEFNDG